MKNLVMKSCVEIPNKFNVPRIAQLSQRSNQFNLRTVRYSEDDIREIANKSDDYQCFSFTLEDKFGDNGLVSVVVLRRIDKNLLFIENWFMSCRVLKRGMENFVLNTIADYAINKGFSHIIGEYIPTAKNSLVQDLYMNLGFVQQEKTERRFFELDLAHFYPLETFISIKEQL